MSTQSHQSPATEAATACGTIINTPDGIAFYRLCSYIAAVKLEAKGLKHSSGLSMTARAKAFYGLTGNAQRVLSQLEAKRDAWVKK